MRSMLDRYQPLRAPDAPGGAPAAPAAPAAAPAGGTPPAAGPSGGGDPAQPGGGNPPAAPGAGDPPAPPAAGQPYRPDGLPDTMYGATDRETMDKMANALKGYRQNDATVGKDADAYKTFDFDKLDASLRPHMEGLAKDPIMDAAAKYALDNKMPVPLVQGLIATVYGEAAKAGVFEGFVDVKAERAALLPENAKDMPPAQQEAAIEARLQANEDWVKLITKSEQNPNGMEKNVADHLLLMLMDKAEGNQALEFFRGRMTGAGAPQPVAGGGGPGAGALTADGLRARQALPQNNPGPQFDQKSYDQLQADYRKLHGE